MCFMIQNSVLLDGLISDRSRSEVETIGRQLGRATLQPMPIQLCSDALLLTPSSKKKLLAKLFQIITEL